MDTTGITIITTGIGFQGITAGGIITGTGFLVTGFIDIKGETASVDSVTLIVAERVGCILTLSQLGLSLKPVGLVVAPALTATTAKEPSASVQSAKLLRPERSKGRSLS